jgi:8-oxo-dGTP pyrophosphatase MutT (NUDIX family)
MSEPPEAPTVSVRPRNAASLVLHRKHRGATEILMGRRASRHRFMPDIYVFPGGRVDRSDRTRPALRELRSDVEARLAARCEAGVARALAVAAVRETHEETGLVLGELHEGQLAPDLSGLDYIARAITPNGNPIRFHARFFLASAERASGRAEDSHELLDLRWFPIEDALKLPIIDVTEFVLQQVNEGIGTPARGVPLLRYRRGQRYIRYE